MKFRVMRQRSPRRSLWRRTLTRSPLQPLVLILTLVNAGLFLTLYDNQGVGRPLFTSYLARNSTYHLSDLYLFQKVVARVERDYVDKHRIDPRAMFQASLEQIERDIPEVLFRFDEDSDNVDVTVDTAHKTIPGCDVRSLSDVVTALRAVLEFVEQHLYSDMPMQEVEYAAVNGFLSTLDPHSLLLPPDMARQMDEQIQGEFGGLGITISLRGEDQTLTVLSTLPGTPAARAGFKPGDRILQIEDESTVNMSLDEAAGKLRGPVDTPVTMLVERPSWDRPRSITLIRDIIRVPSVASHLMDGDIGYVWIKSFQHNTSADLSDALESLATRAHNGLQGLVIDLRDNPGGPLAQAIEVADLFLDHGTIVSTVRGRDGKVDDEAARPHGTQPSYPMAVIVNAESASASEIVAGALKNLDRAVILGETTFGKGSVQNLYAYPNDAKLKLTIAKYLTPGRRSIQSLGIVPDIELIPVYFDDTSAHVYTNPPVFRENDLDSHLEGEGGPLEAPFRTVRYFSDMGDPSPWTGDPRDTPPASTETPATTPAPDEPKPWDDFQARFAQQLLTHAGKPVRSATLRAATAFLDQTEQAQARRIAEQFAAQGIDWSPALDTTPVALRAEVSLSPQPVDAGASLQVTISITNETDRPAFQVRAETESDMGVLDALEFLFGRVAPTETVTKTRTVQMPSNLYPLAEPVRVTVYQGAETVACTTRTSIHVSARPIPQFAYSLVVVDDGSGLSRGNGDGRIQPGEDIDLLLLVRNLGPGPVGKAFAKLTATSGKYVEVRRGTVSFETLDVGGWSAGRFSLTVKPAYRRQRIRAELVFGERLFAMTPPERVVLPVNAELPPILEETPGRVSARGGTPLQLRTCAAEACPPFVVASPDAVLDVSAKTPGWIRVRAPIEDEGVQGWIALEKVRWLPDFRRVSHMEDFRPVFQTVPPKVALDLPELEVRHGVQAVTVRGDVFDDTSIHAVYLFVNGRKIVFRVVDRSEWQTAANGQVRWRFSQQVPLEDGSNLIEVWAQDAEQHQGMDLFQVYRDPAPDTNARESIVAASSQGG